MLKIKAMVWFTSQKKGGHRAFSGIQPSLEIDGQLIACRILNGSLGEPIDPECWHEVDVDLPYGELLADSFRVGREFKLKIASWEIGHGKILGARKAPFP